MGHFIKRGVTIYSFKEMVATGQMTWGDCIARLTAMGVTGMELLGQLFFRNCPEVNQEDLANWKEMMWRYGTKTVAHDFFVDKTMFKGRDLTLRESVEVLKRHVQFAAAIDCPIIRIGGTFDPELFRQAKPICEEYGVTLGVEIHNGSSSWILPSIQKTLDIIAQADTPYLGIIPDMSMFVERIVDSTYFVQGALRQGVDREFIEFMKKMYLEVSNEEYRDRCDKLLAEETDPAKKSFIVQCRRTENHDPKELAELMPYVRHVHGKYWEMDEDCNETSINYAGVLPVLIEGGYEGYISAEYEGRPADGDVFKPQERYQKMLDKYLGKFPNFPEPAEPVKVTDTEVLSNVGYKNRYDEDGNCCGFEIYTRCFYYRGIPLCLIDAMEVSVDGEKFGEDKLTIEVEDASFKFKDMATVQAYYWNYGHLLTVVVDKPGGLDESVPHKFDYMHRLRTYYLPFNHTGTASMELTAIKE
ncbi:MAG: TIM barrel protein [Lachnospiraceae bacterium]|nr:TIM barrel protein [Lachnospiraceae bacterium]